MFERPSHFEINRSSSLAQGLVFAGLGGYGAAGSLLYPDSSGYANHGMLMNMTPPTDWVWVPELGRWALDFDGSDDGVRLATLDSASPNTLAVWINQTTAKTADIFGRLSAYAMFIAEYGFGIYSKSDQTVHAIAANNNSEWSTNLSASMPINTWSHIAFTITGLGASNTGTLYRNGIAVASHTGTAAVYSYYTFNLAYQVYQGHTETQFPGVLSDAVAYNRALTPAEIQQLADPSNVMLSGLIRAPKRRLFAVSAAAPAFQAAWARHCNNLIGA